MDKVKPIGHMGSGVQPKYLLFVSSQSDYFWLRYSKFHIWAWKFQVKVMANVKPDCHIWGLQLNGYICFPFHGKWTIFGWDTANSTLTLKFQGQSQGQCQTRWWHLRPRVQSICLLFVSWQSDIARSTFDLENSRSRSRWKSTKI